MDRNAQTQGWDQVRQAIRHPGGEACVSPDRLHRELERLQMRLEKVQARGGAYREVGWSSDVRMLLARLDAGAALSTSVH